jgi:hypothetical protein
LKGYSFICQKGDRLVFVRYNDLIERIEVERIYLTEEEYLSRAKK